MLDAMWSGAERLCLPAHTGAQGKENNTPEQARIAGLRCGAQQKVSSRSDHIKEGNSKLIWIVSIYKNEGAERITCDEKPKWCATVESKISTQISKGNQLIAVNEP